MSSNKKYAIEGNIAAGKTTIINQLLACDIYGSNANIEYWREPLDFYTNVVSREYPVPVNSLKAFYDDAKTNAFAFQMIALHAHYQIS